MKIQPPHALCLPCNYSLWLTKSYLLSLAPKVPPDPPNLTLQSQFSSCPTASTPVVHLVLLVLCGSSASINLLSFSPLHLRNFSIWIPLPSPPLRSLPGMPLGRLRSNLSSSPIVYVQWCCVWVTWFSLSPSCEIFERKDLPPLVPACYAAEAQGM